MYEAVYSDRQGHLHRAPLTAAANRGSETLAASDYIPLPAGATLTSLPGRRPLAFDERGRVVPVGDEEAWAVGALLPQGFTRTLLPAYRLQAGPAVLPLHGYTAVAFHGERLMVSARAIAEHHRWHPRHFNTADLPRRVAKVKQCLKDNRIVAQLATCALDYGCFTAQNIFYRRWEGGLPVSPTCNARCLGCISLQESDCCPAPQGRITFRPTVEEGAALALFHLTGNSRGEIISFGQGCEGEPALAADSIIKIIRLTRARSDRGAINMNTNGGATDRIKAIVDGGIDMLRVSLISANPAPYRAYYRPRAYDLGDVERSLDYAVSHGVSVSLNLLTLPGFNDRGEEIEALLSLLRRTGVTKVQIRNLNIDDQYFYRALSLTPGKSKGVDVLIDALGEAGIEVGNYSLVE